MIEIIVQGLNISDFVTACDPVPLLVRNQDLSLVAEGFTFEVGFSALSTPQKGNTVLIRFNSSDVYFGIVKTVSVNHDQAVYRVEVENLLLQMEDKLVSYGELGNLFADVVSSDPWSDCSFVLNANSVYAPNHRLYDNEGVVFQTTGSLPGGISPNTVYYVRRLDPDYFQLREHTEASTAILFSSPDNGNHQFNYADVSEWNYRDNENSPNINLNRLLKKLFQSAGLYLDTSEVESSIIYTRNAFGSDYFYDIRTLCIDEYMFYCLNIDSAMHYTRIDDPESKADYSFSKLTIWEFVSVLCGIFGFILVPYNGIWGKYKIIKPAGSFSVHNDRITSLIEKHIVKDGGGYTIYIKRSDTRSAYKSATETELTESEKLVIVGGKEEVTLWKNLKILLRDKRPNAPPGAILPSATYFVELNKLLSNQLNPLKYNRTRKEWSISGDIPTWNILELKIDPEPKLINGISETYDF